MRRPPTILMVGSAAAASFIFTLDLLLESGVAIAVAYVLPVSLAFTGGNRKAVWVASVGCSVLAIVGAFFSPVGAPINQLVLNRLLTILVIWVTTALCLRVMTLFADQIERTQIAEQLAAEAAKQRDEGVHKSRVMASILQDWKETVEEVREQDAQINALLNSTAEGIYGLDLEGNCTFANTACAELLGYDSVEDFIGRNMHTLIHHTRADGTPYPNESCRISQAVLQGEGAHVDNELLWRRDGSSFPSEYWSFPMRRDGELVGGVVTFFDISERKLAESEIQRINEELRRKNSEMQQFVYTVSHDLKSPLVTCKGFVGLMREDAEEGRWEDMLDSVTRVERATERMGDLIEDLLQLSRIGVIRNEPERIDTLAVVRSIVDDHETRLEQDAFKVTICDDLPQVWADPVRFSEVIENLLSNAIKYGGRSESPEITIGGELRNDRVRFFVRDNGPGIAPEFHDKIFLLFQRLDSDKEGTGVGLTAVSRIMEVHGGAAGVDSRLGEGATFWIEFPRDPVTTGIRT